MCCGKTVSYLVETPLAISFKIAIYFHLFQKSKKTVKVGSKILPKLYYKKTASSKNLEYIIKHRHSTI